MREKAAEGPLALVAHLQQLLESQDAHGPVEERVVPVWAKTVCAFRDHFQGCVLLFWVR